MRDWRRHIRTNQTSHTKRQKSLVLVVLVVSAKSPNENRTWCNIGWDTLLYSVAAHINKKNSDFMLLSDPSPIFCI